jgi:hypothetical protein
VCWFGLVSVAVEVGLSRFERDAQGERCTQPLTCRRDPKFVSQQLMEVM